MFDMLMVAAVLIAAGVLSYKSHQRLKSLKKNLNSAFRDLEILLRRRYELIPEFADALQGRLRHERETLNDLLVSRERANLACLMASGDPTNPDAVDELNGAESELRGALRHLMAVVEYYPGLKARRRVTRMIEEFGDLETCIASASHAYNRIADEFNRIKEKWPFMLVSRLLGFKRAEAFWAGRAPVRSQPAPAAADARTKIMARRSPAAKDRCGTPAATAS